VRLVSYRSAGRDAFGVAADDGLIDVTPIADDVGRSIREVLERSALPQVAAWSASRPATVSFEDIEFLPVIPDPHKILCVGINYHAHVKETGRDVPAFPMIFTRFFDSQTGHRTALRRPKVSTRFDFEGELAVVIGKRARHVDESCALQHVAGYSCYNDGSVRDWQRHTAQFTPGKNFPATGAFGPWLVTADALPDVSRLTLSTRLNGQLMQEAQIDDLIFPVPRLIAYCSTFTTLYPGDVIITGTPGGVGAFRTPPIWLAPGDEVEIEISSIGTLRNTIADEE
jgi:2-keto-4-pentenoate hydratase/2-oxohepta-3-ene-1,7-dioic acid hydratase in catechol pathway